MFKKALAQSDFRHSVYKSVLLLTKVRNGRRNKLCQQFLKKFSKNNHFQAQPFGVDRLKLSAASVVGALLAAVDESESTDWRRPGRFPRRCYRPVPTFINFFFVTDHRLKRIHRLLIGKAHLPCFGHVVMSPATTQLWHHNQVQKNNLMNGLHNLKSKL